MSASEGPKIHSFCWAELAAKNSELAKKFYAGLFGWSYHEEEMPEGMGNYIMIFANNLPVGAMFAMTHDVFQGVPAHWGNYVLVENCDESVKKAKALNAEIIKDSFDVMEAGRMAVIKDPAGAVISLWEKKANAGAPAQPMTEGAPCWYELMVPNPKLALDFYSALFGWKSESSDFHGMTYHSLKDSDGESIGGLMETPNGMPFPPSWSTYFTTYNLEKAKNYITTKGGQVLFGPQDVHGMGEFITCQDPDGAVFSVFQFKK